MLFRVDEMRFVRGKKSFVEFRMEHEHLQGTKNGSRYAEGYAFRIYSSRDMKCFLKLWLESIGRTCELSTFHKVSEIVDRYTSFVSEHDEKFLLYLDDIRHGKIYDYV